MQQEGRKFLFDAVHGVELFVEKVGVQGRVQVLVPLPSLDVGMGKTLHQSIVKCVVKYHKP